MTIETIITQLNRISKDSFYHVKDNHIDLTIEDFDGFNEDWSETDRELVDEDAVNAVLEWLEKNADYIDKNEHYHFGDIIIEIDYISSDI